MTTAKPELCRFCGLTLKHPCITNPQAQNCHAQPEPPEVLQPTNAWPFPAGVPACEADRLADLAGLPRGAVQNVPPPQTAPLAINDGVPGTSNDQQEKP